MIAPSVLGKTCRIPAFIYVLSMNDMHEQALNARPGLATIASGTSITHFLSTTRPLRLIFSPSLGVEFRRDSINSIGTKATINISRYSISHVSAFKCNTAIQILFLIMRFMMFLNAEQILLLLVPVLVRSATVTYTIPSAAPTTAVALDPAPLGVS